MMDLIPRVAVIGPVSVAWANPREMRYGGVERVAWRLVHLLHAAGCEVLPIGPADSIFADGVTRSGLWSDSAFHGPAGPRIFAEDVDALMGAYACHVLKVLRSEAPDVILVLGPHVNVIRSVLESRRDATSRAVVIMHNGPSDNIDTIPLLASQSELRVVALSEAQRVAFGDIGRRMQVMSDGIPVEAYRFAAEPQVPLGADSRKVVSHIDYFHPGKGMLITLEMFRRARMSNTHRLVLAGGLGWQLPGRNGVVDPGDHYLAAIHASIQHHRISDDVSVLGSLSGVECAALSASSSLMVSPVRMDHGDLWIGAAQKSDPESYGQGRALANAVGTPVMMSNKYDSRFAFKNADLNVSFADIEGGIRLLGQLARIESPSLRAEVRRFAEITDSVHRALFNYLTIIADICPGVSWDDADKHGLVRLAADLLVELERPSTNPV